MRISDWSSDVCSSDLCDGGTVNVGVDKLGCGEQIGRQLGDNHRRENIADAIVCSLIHTDARQNCSGKRSEERRVGKECVSTCRSRGSPDHEKKKKQEKK